MSEGDTVMPTSVALTEHLEGFIKEQVASGRYNNASEVVRDGLRLLERQQQEEAARLHALREAAKAGFADLDAGNFTEVGVGGLGRYLARLGSTPVSEPPAARRAKKGRR